jgi:hypothetical protein
MPRRLALGAVGVMSVWRLALVGGWRALVLPAALLLTAAWQLRIEATALEGNPGWQGRLHAALLGGALAAALVLAASALARGSPRVRPWIAGALAVGLAALAVVPGAWALSSVLVPAHGVLPSADLARLVSREARLAADGRRLEAAVDLPRLIAFLKANHQGERFLLATSSTMLAASVIVRTGQPVMARGGFHGLDPILTPGRLGEMVAARQVRFVTLGDLSPVSRRLGAEAAQWPIADWVRAHGRLVDPALWRGGVARGIQLYDLRPDAPPVPAPGPA